jgi:hypothetical protein
MSTEKPDLASTLVITAAEAQAATTREARKALLDRKLAHLRIATIAAAGDKWGWEWAMNTTGLENTTC